MINQKVFEITKNANQINLDKVIKTINDDKQIENIKSMFDKHMLEISKFCIQNFIQKDFLEEKFIRELHKIHYPPNYKESQKSILWDWEVITMIPWVYKTLNNFNWVKPWNVKKEINELIEYYNENIDNAEDKFNLIISFLINFLRIHPFGNWNARVISIIADCMLIKNNLNPIYFNLLQNTDKEKYKKIITKSIENNDLDLFMKLIKNKE